MDVRSGLRTIIAALVGIGLIVLVFVLIVKGFSGGGSSAPTVDFGKYQDSAATATLVIDGPTNVDQDHRQVKITVSGSQNEIDIIQGYQGTVTNSKTYSSNPSAFGAFLQSLKVYNYSKGSTAKLDYRGYCPAGDRYLYSFNDGSKDLFNYWSTSCGQGTYGGNRPGVRALFERQIPQNDFDQLTSSISLGGYGV